MTAPGRRRPVLPTRVNFLCYPLALLPIAALFAVALRGWLPVVLLPLALFALFFWLFSLGFAIYARLRTAKEPRQ